MNDKYPYVNEPLPYDFNALEPYIDEKTMQLHHDRHLQTYIDNLNEILKNQPFLQRYTLKELLQMIYLLPESLQTPIQNNAGGVYNHRLYFALLQPGGEQEPTGKLAEALVQRYGSFEAFKTEFTNAALSVFGSGYAWLVVDEEGKLDIMITADQDTPLLQNACPVLLIDMWEHAYYLKHYNMRKAYIEDWFKVLNWVYANELYEMCMNQEMKPIF